MLVLASLIYGLIVLKSSLFTVAASNVAAVDQPVAATQTYEGKLAAVTEKGVTLVGRQGENLGFTPAADCAITLDGKPVTILMLGVGSTARIVAMQQGSDRIAKRIDARSSE